MPNHCRNSTSPDYPPPRSSSPPSLTYHPQIFPQVIPTPSLIESVAGAAHYSGVRVDSGGIHHRRRSSVPVEHHTDLDEHHELVMKDILELYSCRPTKEIFERSWRRDATFEDPFSICKGYQEYAAQWFVLPKLFPKSVTISTRVMSSTVSPNRLVYYQVQEYTLRLLGYKKTVESVIDVDMDEEGKIIRLTEQWQGRDPSQWFGATIFRTLSAKAMPWFIRVPKYAS